MKETATHSETDQNQGFKAWWKRNWKKVATVAAAVGGGTLVVLNWDQIQAIAGNLFETLKPVAETVSNTVEELEVSPVAEDAAEKVRKAPESPFDVGMFVRTMPDNRNPSAAKLAEADILGIDLKPHQTIVDPYTKGKKVA